MTKLLCGSAFLPVVGFSALIVTPFRVGFFSWLWLWLGPSWIHVGFSCWVDVPGSGGKRGGLRLWIPFCGGISLVAVGLLALLGGFGRPCLSLLPTQCKDNGHAQGTTPRGSWSRYSRSPCFPRSCSPLRCWSLRVRASGLLCRVSLYRAKMNKQNHRIPSTATGN